MTSSHQHRLLEIVSIGKEFIESLITETEKETWDISSDSIPVTPFVQCLTSNKTISTIMELKQLNVIKLPNKKQEGTFSKNMFLLGTQKRIIIYSKHPIVENNMNILSSPQLIVSHLIQDSFAVRISLSREQDSLQIPPKCKLLLTLFLVM